METSIQGAGLCHIYRHSQPWRVKVIPFAAVNNPAAGALRYPAGNEQ
ncbi:hypothetical protein P8631_02200 [Guyparkeria sp. 1SP6A2]|nr:hypothetical protein [Guyparkeria sp. 1SP6A2]